MPYANVLFETKDRIATITLNRPERRNAININTTFELMAVLTGLRDDAEVRVLVIRGAGPAFCAGADVSVTKGVADPTERERLFAAQRKRNARHNVRMFEALEGLEQVTIAAINGYCIGAGWAIANCCDFRIAAEDAQLWFPEVDLGVPLGYSTTARLARLVGPALAKEIIMTCDHYTARQVMQMGLLNEVVAPDQLETVTYGLARKLAAKNWSALTQVKAMVHAASGVQAAQALVITPYLLLATEG